jgi:hypothetical protein
MARYNYDEEDKMKIRRIYDCPVCFLPLDTKKKLREHKWTHRIE